MKEGEVTVYIHIEVLLSNKPFIMATHSTYRWITKEPTTLHDVTTWVHTTGIVTLSPTVELEKQEAI